MHIYLKYQNSNTFGSKDIAQVKVFFKVGQSSRSRSQGQSLGTIGKVLVQRKCLFKMHLYLKNQSSSTFGQRDIAQGKVFQN
jgi:hypothetical protein